jgi:uncharacterized membrane protein
MDILLILARLLHVGLGVFWAGTALFNAFFLAPAFQEAGPDGAKVGAALMRRGMMTVLPVAAITTVLSGFYLYWRMSGGGSGFMATRQGMTLGTGGLAATLALVLGLVVARPAMVNAAAVGQRAAQASGAERDALMAQAAALRSRSNAASQVVTWLLILTLAAMAVARYL